MRGTTARARAVRALCPGPGILIEAAAIAICSMRTKKSPRKTRGAGARKRRPRARRVYRARGGVRAAWDCVHASRNVPVRTRRRGMAGAAIAERRHHTSAATRAWTRANERQGHAHAPPRCDSGLRSRARRAARRPRQAHAVRQKKSAHSSAATLPRAAGGAPHGQASPQHHVPPCARTPCGGGSAKGARARNPPTDAARPRPRLLES